MKQTNFLTKLLLLCLCVVGSVNAWAYDGASGDVSFVKINGGGKANKMATDCYYYRPSSGYSWSDGNGVKTQNNASSVVFYIDKTTDVTVDIKHTEAKNAHTVTASVYSLTESAYSAFSSITSETAVTFSLPVSTSTTFDISITTSTGTFAGTKQLTSGYYAIVCTGDSNDKGKAFFNAIHFAAVDSRPAAPISWSAASAVAAIGGSNSYPSLINESELTVSYSSSNTGVATINASTGAITLAAAGTTTISATYTTTGPSDTYKTTKVSYTLVVSTLVAQSNKFWKFSDAAWSTYATTSSNQTVDNMEIITNSTSDMGISDADYTTDGVKFTKQMTTNGSSTSARRTLHIFVAPNSKVTAYVRPNGNNRYIKISNGSYDNTSDQAVSDELTSTSTAYKLSHTNEAGGDVYIHVTNNCHYLGVKVVPYHSVTYALNGGTGTLPTETVKGEGEKFTLHDGTTGITAPDGKVFGGWSDGTKTYAGGAEYTMSTSNVTLTAQWRIPVAAPTGLECSAHTKNSLTFSWTAADHASSYDVTLYSDSECSSEVASDNVTTTSKTFTGLSSTVTYYCKVQSKGDDVTYSAEGGTTDAVSGTTDGKDYTVTVVSSDENKGTVATDDVALDEGETTTITATPGTGYQVANWAVSGEGATISPSGDSHSLTTTLTMGTANATVTATFGLKDYTVTLDNQSATTAGTTSVTTNYNKNTNLTTSITCPAKTDYVFMGYYTAANGEGVRLIDNSGAWIANVSEYTDASKNWINDGNVTLYACWMKYATSANFNLHAFATLPLEGSGTSTSNSFDYLTSKNISYSLSGSTVFDHSKNAPFVGLKIKNNADYIKFAVEAGKQVRIVFGSIATAPKQSIDGSAEETISVSTDQEVYYASTSSDRLFKIKTADGNSMVIKKLFIEDAATTEVTATMGANGFTTFASPYALDLKDARPTGLKAYTATLTGATLSFTPVNAKVAAGTGLLLLGDPNESYDITIVNEAGTVSTNDLVGVTESTSMQSMADQYYYFFMKKASSDADPLKFLPLSTTAVTTPAGKAFLEVPNSAFGSGSARELSFTFEDGETTGIKTIDNEQLTIDSYYDLSGRKVAQPAKGLFIVNGKKVIIK